MRPLSLMESSLFWAALKHTSHDTFKGLSHQTVTRELRSISEGEIIPALKKKLALLDSVSFTTDMWSDDAPRGYTAVTVHYISVAENPPIQQSLISFSSFAGRHTAQRMAEHINYALQLEEENFTRI